MAKPNPLPTLRKQLATLNGVSLAQFQQRPARTLRTDALLECTLAERNGTEVFTACLRAAPSPAGDGVVVLTLPGVSEVRFELSGTAYRSLGAGFSVPVQFEGHRVLKLAR